MTTTLITGANRGLGFEVARQLVAAGHQVWLAARDDTRGKRTAHAVGARFVQLDVTDDAAVTAAAERDADTLGDLTAQEAQIAELAREGQSNPEIGAQLFLSPRTVDGTCTRS